MQKACSGRALARLLQESATEDLTDAVISSGSEKSIFQAGTVACPTLRDNADIS